LLTSTFKKLQKYILENLKQLLYLHRQTRKQHAQLAELVDALVSNTNIFGCAGSTPALGTKRLEID
jgi:hypothetical protein